VYGGAPVVEWQFCQPIMFTCDCYNTVVEIHIHSKDKV
jgi:hypothetical protein